MTDEPEVLDILIIGAGISGIGAAHYVQANLPGHSYAIIESRAELGGTWSLFRYPGIRSDSDLYTFGYEFRPWRSERSIASADLIRDYLHATVDEEGIAPRIRYRQRVRELSWSSAAQRWTAVVERTGEGEWPGNGTGETYELCVKWIFSATGYYRYDHGYAPAFPGQDDFQGQIVHPQQWPDDLDYAGKRIAVIGSGATAVTIVPAMAASAAHVTQLQRTPTYVLPEPSVDATALRLQRWFSPDRAHRLIRGKNIATSWVMLAVSHNAPSLMRRFIRWANVKSLPEGYPVDEHFRPPYQPWDQRLCACPDGDYFTALRDGTASVVTDSVRTFTATGILTESGRHIDADIIVTATGLTLLPMGGIPISVDGAAVHLPEHVTYRGMMLDGIPNYAYAVGYTKSSWTLKIGMLWDHFTRLIAHAEATGMGSVTPQLPPGEMATRPLLDFGAGYIQRSMAELPRQGAKAPWASAFDYRGDVKLLRRAPVDSLDLRFVPAVAPEPVRA